MYQNHLFLKSLLGWMSPDCAPEPLCYANQAADAWSHVHGLAVPIGDHEKVRYVLKNLMRDWSAEGKEERQQSYGRITQELETRLSEQLRAARQGAAPPPAVLVPGCGLARLCVEVAALGCEALGNEHSYFMLLASAFMLNGMERPEQVRLAYLRPPSASYATSKVAS